MKSTFFGELIEPPDVKLMLGLSDEMGRLELRWILGKGSRKEKVLLLMAGPLRPNPPSPRAKGPLEIWYVGKQFKNKSSFFLNGPAFTPLPPPY